MQIEPFVNPSETLLKPIFLTSSLQKSHSARYEDNIGSSLYFQELHMCLSVWFFSCYKQKSSHFSVSWSAINPTHLFLVRLVMQAEMYTLYIAIKNRGLSLKYKYKRLYVDNTKIKVFQANRYGQAKWAIILHGTICTWMTTDETGIFIHFNINFTLQVNNNKQAWIQRKQKEA